MMNNLDYVEIAKGYVDLVKINKLCDSSCKTLHEFLEYTYLDYCIKTGATKVVLVSSEDNKVIKIPLLGDKDGMFTGSINSLNLPYDYCAREVDLYQKAIELGLEDAFLCVTNLGSYLVTNRLDKVYFYIQDKADSTGKLTKSSYSKESMKTFEEYSSILGTDMDEDWGAAMIEYYGKEYCYDLFNFLDKEKIYDLHPGNFGYFHNRPIVTDFGGYVY